MKRSWAIWLSQDGTRGWSLHTRANSPQAAAVSRDMYRARGFHVRVAQEFGRHTVMVYAPLNPPEAPSRADGGPQTPELLTETTLPPGPSDLGTGASNPDGIIIT